MIGGVSIGAKQAGVAKELITFATAPAVIAAATTVAIAPKNRFLIERFLRLDHRGRHHLQDALTGGHENHR